MRKLALLFAFVCSVAAVARGQSINDPTLQLQTWTSGLNKPTGAAFFNGRGDLFALEKNTGMVKIIRDRKVRSVALDLPVANDSERGLLGMALSPTFASDNFVYLYYTGADRDGGVANGNHIVRYQYDGSKLVYKRTIKNLPGDVGPNHDGGKISFGPDGKLYAVIGDLNLNNANSNYKNTSVNRTGAVLRMEPYGAAATDNPFYKASRVGQPDEPANDIYAYGIRNSFGFDFDPVTKQLWETENGRDKYDEINHVTPGFNGGWEKIMGPAARNGGVPGGLVSFGAAAHYEDPEFSWLACVAPTDALFYPTQKLGAAYKNDLFVGTTRGGKILRYDLTADRQSLILNGVLADGVADGTDANRFLESESLTFGQDFGTITDLISGPGGLYVLSYDNGALYRITPKVAAGLYASGLITPAEFATASAVPEPTAVLFLGAPALLLLKRRKRYTER